MKRVLAIGALSALLLSACQATTPTTGTGSTTSSSAVIKIGYIGPLTGDAASTGTDNLHGAQMAVDEINAAGGIKGQQVQLIAEDGRCNGADSASAAQKLVNVDHVVGIIGGQCSSETLAAAPIVEAGKVPLISPWSSNPSITQAGDFVFRVYPSDALKGTALGIYLRDKGFKKLAIITENTDACQGIRDSVIAGLLPGTKVVFDEQVDAGTKDVRSLLTRMKKVNFDVFLPNGQSDSTVATMVKQMRDLGMKQQIIGTDVADSENLPKIAGDAVEGLRPLSVPLLSTMDPKGKTFSDAFHVKYGEPQYGMFFAALSYDATHILLRAIQKAGTDGDNVRQALNFSDPYEGVAGTISFDSNGDVIGIPFAMKVFKDGKLEQLDVINVDSSAGNASSAVTSSSAMSAATSSKSMSSAAAMSSSKGMMSSAPSAY